MSTAIKKWVVVWCVFFWAHPSWAQDRAQMVVPRPEKVTSEDKVGFELNEQTCVFFVGGQEARQEAELLAQQLRVATGLPLPVSVEDKGNNNVIALKLDLAEQASEGYGLKVEKRAQISASTSAGLFYGAQTLRQLLPPSIYAKTKQEGVKWTLPACEINDSPRYPYRGFMLDYARQFFGMEYTKHILDEMSARKMNVFHMHLTDDDGWRIEIKKYPKLTSIGAWRGYKCALPSLLKDEWTPAYGGFFTQEQIKEIVAYAAARHIQVLPEIDLPGHALALVTAYPETLPTRLWEGDLNGRGFANNLISPAKEANFQMIDGILEEVAALFPYPYVHVGGDEVDYWFWNNCPDVQALVKKENLKGTQELQGYFSGRIEKILAKHGKKMMGWSELASHSISKQTTLMSWKGRADAQGIINGGFPLIVAHSPDISPDMVYAHPSDEPPVPGFAGPVSFQRGYEFDPQAYLPKGANVQGVEGCVWGEYIAPWKSRTGWLELKTIQEAADFKAFPRLCALADLGWSKNKVDAQAPLQDRLAMDLKRLDMTGTIYRVPTPEVKKGIQIVPPCDGVQVCYALDGSDPLMSTKRNIWNGNAIAVESPARIAVRATIDGHQSPLCFGVSGNIVGRWEDVNTTRKWQTKELKLDLPIPRNGLWNLRFKKFGGIHTIEVGCVDLMVNGKVIAHRSSGGLVRLFEKTKMDGEATLRYDYRVLGPEVEPEESFGYVLLEPVDGLPYKAHVYSTLEPLNKEFTVDNLANEDARAYFWSADSAKKDDYVLWSFNEPMELESVQLNTGVPNALQQDQLLLGALEVSVDGKTFKEVSRFEKGFAQAYFSKQTIKAVRVRVTEDQDHSCLAVQRLILGR